MPKNSDNNDSFGLTYKPKQPNNKDAQNYNERNKWMY